MPLPVAHGLVAASVVAALRRSSQSPKWKPFLIGSFVGICPDFDYALNWLRISGGGWHHGFTHSIAFALLLGLITVIALREWDARSLILYSSAAASHTLLDYLMTESRGVALWWPFTNRRYHLRLANPIDYTWSTASLSQASVDILRICFTELMIFAPILLVVVLIRRVIAQRGVAE
jgi:inner membrane protein